VKPLLHSFSMFVRQIFKDSMLAVICISTVLSAVLIRFGIPRLELFLCSRFDRISILADYYLLFDLLLALLAPYMLCFASSMMMLTEYDEEITGYLAVTPVGKQGYILSRLVFPSVIAFVVSAVFLHWFSLTVWPIGWLVLASALSCAVSTALALLLFSLSHNRVEGMAVGKLSGLVMLGLAVPFFLPASIAYLFAPLPSFWLAKLCITRNLLFLFPSLSCTLIWLWSLSWKFSRKIR